LRRNPEKENGTEKKAEEAKRKEPAPVAVETKIEQKKKK